MKKSNSSKAKRISLFTAGGLMMVCALIYWFSDTGIIIAACSAAAGLCFLAAGLNVKDDKDDDKNNG